MKWIEKVRFLKEKKELKDYDEDEYYIDASLKMHRWEKDELENITKGYSFIPKEYIEFIKEFDGSTISFCTFYGSKKSSRHESLKGWIEELSEYTEIFKHKYFAFGKDVDGSVFAFNQDQQVVRFDIEDYEFENEPEHISDSFPEFIDQYVLGSKHWDKSDEEWSKFYKFLKHLNWV